jgi:anti-sigma factor RsiW
MNQPLDCQRARLLLHDGQLGRLDPITSDALAEHTRTCAECARVDAEERVLSELLATHLPPMAAPARLHQRLSAPLPLAKDRPLTAPRRHVPFAAISTSFGAFALLAAAWLLWPRGAIDPNSPLLREVVNDHLRVVYAQRPIEIESGGIHQVKPWFTGRLDFAPDVSFSGDADFPMVGGAVGYMIDRKAATMVFQRRLHTISLFVFRSAGLPWPHTATQAMGSVQAQVGKVDGFNVVLWHDAELGHALVSDASANELLHLGRKIVETH